MNKKTRLKLNETLNKALEAPKRKDLSKLDELLSPFNVPEKPRLELVNKESPANLPAVLPTNQPTNLPTVAQKQPVSPERDFSKVPNSVKRFVEAGKFPNSSLAIYMYLYSLTRGGIHPKRSVRVNKAKLLNGSDLRSEKALLKNLAHLKNIGLLKITIFNGEHAGNEYEVLVPEEITGDAPTYLPTKQPTYLPTKHTLLPTVQIEVGRTVESEENKEDADVLRLSLKTNTNDDDETLAFSSLIGKFAAASKKITGKGISRKDRTNWEQLADLLVMELEMAAARADVVSNVPAFLTEHLRRRLADKPSPSEKSARAPQTGKRLTKSVDAVAVEYQAEPLTEQGREQVLKTMREYIEKGQKDFVLNLKETYTKIDWKFLMEELEK